MDDSVSAFIVGTCRTLPKSTDNVYKLISFPISDGMKQNAFVSGSCAEFFIQPIQPCFGDVDYLLVISERLAFTNEKIVLPYDSRHIANPIHCLLMEPYLDYPAFVRLRILGQMIYDWKRKTFEFFRDSARDILHTDERKKLVINGPWSAPQLGVASWESIQSHSIL